MFRLYVVCIAYSIYVRFVSCMVCKFVRTEDQKLATNFSIYVLPAVIEIDNGRLKE